MTRFFIIIFFLSIINLKADKKPEIPYLPIIRCVEKGDKFESGFRVRDSSLCDEENPEVLVLEVVSPHGFTVDPDTIFGPVYDENGNCHPDSLIWVDIFSDNFDYPADANHYVQIIIRATDKSGNQVEKTIRMIQSEPLMWSAGITFYNDFDFLDKDSVSYYSSRQIVFGNAPPESEATTGDGIDGNPVYSIDWHLCEKPAPPRINSLMARFTVGPTDFFRSIYPYHINTENQIEYRIIANESYDPDTGETLWPLAFSWRPSDIPGLKDIERNPNGYRWMLVDGNSINTGGLSIDMHSLDGYMSKSYEMRKIDSMVYIKYYGGSQNEKPDNKYYKIIRVMPTGIQEVFKRSTVDFILYPNPANDNISFILADSVDNAIISIFDRFGRIIVSKKDNVISNREYNLELLNNGVTIPPGFYFLRIKRKNDVLTKPLIIIR